jgi:hypothetical protein
MCHTTSWSDAYTYFFTCNFGWNSMACKKVGIQAVRHGNPCREDYLWILPLYFHLLPFASVPSLGSLASPSAHSIVSRCRTAAARAPPNPLFRSFLLLPLYGFQDSCVPISASSLHMYPRPKIRSVALPSVAFCFHVSRTHSLVSIKSVWLSIILDIDLDQPPSAFPCPPRLVNTDRRLSSDITEKPFLVPLRCPCQLCFVP